MSQTSRDSSSINERIDIAPEYQFETPAIDRLLDYVWNEEARKPAIDRLIQEYLERIGSPLVHSSSSSFITPLKSIEIENSIQDDQSAPSFYHTPISSDSDHVASTSTPLLRPFFIHTNDRSQNTPAFSPDDRFSSKDYCLKQAAAQERRQATRHFGKVQPGLIWTSPLPIQPRTFSIRPASLSSKIFLGGIPHDINPRDLQACLERYGPVRLEWPNGDHMSTHRNCSSNQKYDRLIRNGFVYAVYQNEASIHQILHECFTKSDQTLNDGRCEYYLNIHSQRRKSIQIIPWFVEDSQWLAEDRYRNCEQRFDSTECINRTVFVGALHGMMTAYALAKICQELFGDVEYVAIDTDRNKYPIGSGRVVFVNAHSYYAAVTANYVMIECDKFRKVIQIDPYLSDNVPCAGTNGKWCSHVGQYFCRSLKCMKYYCATCWDLNPNHRINNNIEYESPAMSHKPLMRNVRTS